MAFLDKIKSVFLKEEAKSIYEEDYIKIAKDFEEKLMFAEAAKEYEKLIANIYAGKEYTKYLHLNKKLVELYSKIGNFDMVKELWQKQYDPENYGPKQKLELALILEKAGKISDATDIFDNGGFALHYPKIEFLMRQRKIDEANTECTRLLLSLRPNDPGMVHVLMLKGKILMGIRRWEEAESYFLKVLERQNNHIEAKKLRSFCLEQLRKY
jgi:tetratricopeptide (TPR) repeat protein